MPTIGKGSPLLYVEGTARQTGSSGHSRTIEVTAKFKVNGGSGSYYGYPCNWRARVHNSYGSWTAIKGGESWSGGNALRTFKQTLTVDVGTTSAKSIVVGIYTNSYNGDDDWDGNYNWSITAGSTNTPPTFKDSDYIEIREDNSNGAIISSAGWGTENSVKVRENVSNIYLNWPDAADKEGGGLTYELWQQTNEGSFSKIREGITTSYYTLSIGAGNEGRSYDYYVRAKDNKGALSGNCNTTQFIKNSFTTDTIRSSTSIVYSDKNPTFSLSYSGAKNTNGNTSFSRTLSCDGITVYNPVVGANSATITVCKSGTTSSNCYVKFDDIKNRFKNSGYKGNLVFTLSTRNAYGTTKQSSISVPVNLNTRPNPPTGVTISKNSNSTAWTGAYFVPNGSKTVRVSWNPGSGKLGESVYHDVYISHDDGRSWGLLSSNQTENYYYDAMPINSSGSGKSFKYLIRTKCRHDSNLWTDSVCGNEIAHTYYGPVASSSSVTRESSRVSARVIITCSTSIAGTTVSGTARLYKKGTSTPVGNQVTINPYSGGIKDIVITGLTEGGSYDLKVFYNDSTGITTSSKTLVVPISPLAPALDINKYGIGVGGLKADENASLKVRGTVYADNVIMNAPRIGAESGVTRPAQSGFTVRDCYNDGGYPYSYGNALTVRGTGDSQLFMGWSGISGGNAHLYYRSRRDIGEAHWSEWATIYSTANKPTLADIGAAPSSSYNSITIHADKDNSSTSEWASLKAGVNELWVTSSAGNKNNSNLFYNGHQVYHAGNQPTHTNGKRFNWKWGTTAPSHIWGTNGNATEQYVYRIAKEGGNGAFGAIPYIEADGVMEIGRYIDLHMTSDGSEDYSARIEARSDRDIAVSRYIWVDGRKFKGWAFTSKGNYWLGLSGEDDYLRMYVDGGSVANNVTYIGSPSARFKKIHTVSAADVSSDRRYKENILSCNDSKLEELYSKLKPCSWTRIDGDSGRRHYGFIAQEVEDAMTEVGMGYKDMAFLQKAPLDADKKEIRPETIKNYDTDPRIKDYEYSLAYEELIAVNTHMIQKLQKSNKELTDRLSKLESRMSDILNKIEPIPQVEL